MIQAFGLTSDPRRELPPAVDDVSFEARAGHVTVLLGASGAGKTTALRLMLELQHGRGLTYFRGRPLHRIAHPSREVGVLLGDVPGHPARTVRGHLRMLCAASGVPVRRADEVLESADLVSLCDERIGTLSRGMGRRVGLACALVPDPHTLVLDDPAGALTVGEARRLHGTLRAYAAQGGTVLLSTADSKEAARTADHVVTLERGRVVADQEVADFSRTRLRPRVAVRTPHAARLAALLAKEARAARRSVEVVCEGGNRLAVYGSTCADIGEAAFRHGILVHQLADEIGDMGPGAGAGASAGTVLVARRQGGEGDRAPAAQGPTAPGPSPTGPAHPVAGNSRATGRHRPAGDDSRQPDAPRPLPADTPLPTGDAASSVPGERDLLADTPQPSADEVRPGPEETHLLTETPQSSSGETRPVGTRPRLSTEGSGAVADGPRPAVADRLLLADAPQPLPDETGPGARVRTPHSAAEAQPAAGGAEGSASTSEPLIGGLQPLRGGPGLRADAPAVDGHEHLDTTAQAPSAADGHADTPTPGDAPAPATALAPHKTSAPLESPVPLEAPTPREPFSPRTAPAPREAPTPGTSPGPDATRTSPPALTAPRHTPLPHTAPAPASAPVPVPVPVPVPTPAPVPVPVPVPVPTPAPAPVPVPAPAGAPSRQAASSLPPPIRVRSAPSPLRPLRYELRRAVGISTGFVTGAVVLVVSAVTAVVLARAGHTPQPRLLAAWPRELPLPPAALGAGLLGALAFGDEFRHPALAADRGTVPRRMGLLTAKLLVSAATALVLAVLTVGCNTEVLQLFYGQEFARVPAEWPALSAGWLGLIIGCAWSGVLAAGVFRSTTAGLAAVVAVPVLVVPLVQRVWEGPSVRSAAGLPMRAREVLLTQWPFGGERYLAEVLRMFVQPVGGALTLSLTALLCAYLLMNLRSRAR